MNQIRWQTTSFIKFVICFVLLFDQCIAMGKKPTYMSPDCWDSYTKTWVTSRTEISEADDIHERMAYRVTLATKKDIPDLGFSNVASFALSIRYADGQWAHLLLPFVVASCEIIASEDSSAYYWQKSGYIPVVSVSQFFQSNPSHGFSTADATTSFISRIMKAQEEGLYPEENWQLRQALLLLEQRVQSGSYLTHLIKPVGTESGEASDTLRSVLHCEQVVVDRMMRDPEFLDLFLRQLPQEKKQIVGVDFHIDTYNDMCPKCFSTCKHMKYQLLKYITERLALKHDVDVAPNMFRILISSHREYKIPETDHITGKIIDSSCTGTDSIFQFRNDGTREASTKIERIEKIRSQKCDEIENLFSQIKTASSIDPKSKLELVEKRYLESVFMDLETSNKNHEMSNDCDIFSGFC